MAFPDSIYEQREVENLPGLEYDPDNKKTLFAEDVMGLGNELTAIEETLGQEVAGEYTTVAERLDNMGGGGGPIEEVTLTTAQATFEFSTPISMNNAKYLKIGVIIPGTLLNGHPVMTVNDDTTGGNYQKNVLNTTYSGTAVATQNTTTLDQLGVAEDNTAMIDVELFKLAGKFLNYWVRQTSFSGFGDVLQRYQHFKYTGTSGDITKIKFSRSGGTYPAGTTFILRGF